MFTKENLQVYLRRHWLEKGESLGEGERLGVDISELIGASIERNAAIEAPYIDLWVAILDELNSWLISLLTTLYAPAEVDDYRMNDFERSVVVILTKLIADTTALRHLVTMGFDGSARTLLRSIAEYIQALVVILDDPSLANEFVEANTPESANRFYFRHLARGKLEKGLGKAWARFFKDDNDAAPYFANRQRDLSQVLAGTAHPSFAGGTQAAMGFIDAEPNEKWLGHWGAKSNMSVLTIDIYTSCFLPLLVLTDFPFSGYEQCLRRPIAYDNSSEMHRHVKAGRSVLASLLLSLNEDGNFPRIYPQGFEPDASLHRSLQAE